MFKSVEINWRCKRPVVIEHDLSKVWNAGAIFDVDIFVVYRYRLC